MLDELQALTQKVLAKVRVTWTGRPHSVQQNHWHAITEYAQRLQ